MTDTPAAVRLDKWLWAARFFKTRTLAGNALKGGKVHINGGRAKASRLIRAGDTLRIHCGAEEYTITVQALSQRRGPAREAHQLYEETAASLLRRLAARQAPSRQAPHPAGRPGKRDRRRIVAFTRGE